MKTRAKVVRLGGAVALAAALVACQTGPAPPLLSPLDQTKRYGFAERDVGPDRVAISYVGPRHRAPSYAPTPRDADTQPARIEALDLATWRASQIALARGFKGFRLIDRETQLDSRPDALYPGADWGPWPYWRYPGGFIYGPPGYYAAPYLEIQARATVTALLLHELRPDDLDAATAIARLRATYPGAEGPAQAAPPTAPGGPVAPR